MTNEQGQVILEILQNWYGVSESQQLRAIWLVVKGQNSCQVVESLRDLENCAGDSLDCYYKLASARKAVSQAEKDLKEAEANEVAANRRFDALVAQQMHQQRKSL